MAVLGQGAAHGACTLLHALGAGYGSSLGLELSTKVRLRDDEPNNMPEDPSNLLEHTVAVWEDAGLTRPARYLFWQVRSDVPTGVGLKSSAALSVAAIRALMEATEVELQDSDIVDLASRAQLTAGVSLTGSVDDSWAALTPGWKVVDPNIPAGQGVLLEGEFPVPDEWVVIIALRGDRELLPVPERFALGSEQFQAAVNAIEQGDLLLAMTLNGRAVATALADGPGRRLANDMMVWGARAAGISGSGPAIVSFIPSINPTTVRRIEVTFEQRGIEFIETRVWSG